jgi:hypothetical protein
MDGRKFLIYEINTRVWLNTLGRRHGKAVTLANVPDAVIKDLARHGIGAVWLMGVWTRGKGAREGALRYSHEYVAALPDLTEDDIIGSAYAIGKYESAADTGGRAGLATFRTQLIQHGIRLITDFVPNHVATDHSWVVADDGLCIRGTTALLRDRPGEFFESVRPDGSTAITAHGRDPNFPPWNDTAQLNAFDPVMRQTVITTLRDIAVQCDGVRCDMAMLVMNDIFRRTWGWLVDLPTPPADFWPEVITAVKQVNPGFLFIAEAYWGLEGVLQDQGFDYTYDKALYDLLRDEDVPALAGHLRADIGFQSRTLRFIENHDEPRAAVAFQSADKSRAAATVTMTVPGAVLLHDGQLEGRRIKLPVQIAREKDEPIDAPLRTFYEKLLDEVQATEFARGEFRMLPTSGKLIAYSWTLGSSVRLVIANVTGETQAGTVTLELCGSRPLTNVRTNQIIAPVGERLEVYLQPYAVNLYHIDMSVPAQKTLGEKVGAKVTGVYRQVANWIKGEGSYG